MSGPSKRKDSGPQPPYRGDMHAETLAAGYEVLPEMPDRLPPYVAPKRFYASLEGDGHGVAYKQGDDLCVHLRHDAVETLRLVVDTRVQDGVPWVRVYASDYTPGVPIRVFYDGPAAELMTRGRLGPVEMIDGGARPAEVGP